MGFREDLLLGHGISSSYPPPVGLSGFGSQEEDHQKRNPKLGETIHIYIYIYIHTYTYIYIYI